MKSDEWLDENGTRHWIDEHGREHVDLDAHQTLHLDIEYNSTTTEGE